MGTRCAQHSKSWKFYCSIICGLMKGQCSKQVCSLAFSSTQPQARKQSPNIIITTTCHNKCGCPFCTKFLSPLNFLPFIKPEVHFYGGCLAKLYYPFHTIIIFAIHFYCPISAKASHKQLLPFKYP